MNKNELDKSLLLWSSWTRGSPWINNKQFEESILFSKWDKLTKPELIKTLEEVKDRKIIKSNELTNLSFS